MAYSMRLVVRWGDPVYIRSFDDLQEAVRYAKFINMCNKCDYIIAVGGTKNILYDTRVPPETDGWQKLGF